MADQKATESQRSDKTLELAVQFLQRARPANERDTLMRYLSIDSDPRRSNMTSLLPLDELTQRLELIEKIEKHLDKDKVQFSSELFALLLFLTEQEESASVQSANFGSSAGSSAGAQKGAKRSASGKGSTGSRRKRGKKVSEDDEAFDPNVKYNKQGNPNRNKPLGPKRKKLDGGKCIVIVTAIPDAAHIIPWASCNNDGRVNMFKACLRLLGQALVSDKDYDIDVKLNYPGVSDKLWNVISLNP
ncbi:hypothetical protein B0T25DRAFT_561789 [Lasiosphaeria hispida]|uniref:HNH nuclease domain-containing protein n=1 Tax=Lasiosphaeria hispida TaxID=260671 RepID=A0AAJ0HU51_9PEZI|nr:hypothetical protein B0T25DRAFT_561789 [Lasiosphaeria hispida]